MRLDETVLGHLYTTHGLSYFIRSTLGVKQGYPLSPTLFGIYIDELEYFLKEHIQDKDGCLLHHVLTCLLLFVDDMILLASTPKGLQRQLNVLSLLQYSTIDCKPSQTKIMIFNVSKRALLLPLLLSSGRGQDHHSIHLFGSLVLITSIQLETCFPTSTH
jgi:hypothetical protein